MDNFKPKLMYTFGDHIKMEINLEYFQDANAVTNIGFSDELKTFIDKVSEISNLFESIKGTK